MNMLKLLLPEKSFLSDYKKAIKEYEENKVDTYYFSIPEKYDIFEKFNNYRLGVNLPSNRVPSITYWLIEKEEFIGEVVIRPRLNDTLLKYGGNIGYGIRYSKWNQGYGTRMLKLALVEAKKLGMDRVLITCDEDNYGSEKVIINNGGVLENIIENMIEGKVIYTKRYWITL